MTACFPDLLPDELFYSACARFSDRVNYPSNKTVRKEIFGNINIKGVIDLPCHLGTFIERLPYGHIYTTDVLIDQHTLFPIFAPFVPKDRARSIRELMISDNGSLIHKKLGTVSSQLCSMPYIRYCPSCVKEDIIRFGECYWHRSHQVRGLEICPEHLTFIESSSIRTRSQFASSIYFSAERSITSVTPRIADVTDPKNQMLLNIAKDVVYLLSHPGISLTSQQFIGQYNTLLDKNNFITIKGLVRHIDLIEAFIAYYTPELLEQFNCTIYNGQAFNSWLARLVRTVRDTHPYLHHLLTIRFLGASIDDFFNQKIEPPAPFGKGPWPCLNPVCSHYNEKCVQSYQIKRKHGKESKALGIFSCTCGFTYGKRGPDRTSSDVYHKDQIISYGEVWETKLKELWLNATVTRRQIAHILHVSEACVRDRAVKLQLPIPRKSPSMSGGRPPLIRDLASYRASWLNLLKESPEAGLTDLRNKMPVIYKWLSKNDKEWFVVHCPSPKIPSHTKGKKNKSFLKEAGQIEYSTDKDVDMAKRVRIVADQLLTIPGPPKRLSLRAISTHLPQIIWLRSRKPHTMPLTMQALNEVIETREQYAIRRIWFVMRQYQQEGCFPSRRSFAVRANIKPLLHIPLIKQTFEEALSQLSKNGAF